MPTEYERHEFSYAWPEIAAAQLGLLVQSMRVNGFDPEQPIALYEGQILDGWNRYRAALRAGVDPKFSEFNGTDRQALSFIEMRNSSRRQLTKGQQALALRKIDLQRPEPARRTVEEIAALIGGGSTGTVRQAFKMSDEAPPEVVEDVASGRRKFDKAYREEVSAENLSSTKSATASPGVSIKLLTRIDSAARIRGEHFKPITPKRAMSEALAIWCKAREEGRNLAIVDF